MALPKNYRWITVGKLRVRNHASAPDNAPLFALIDLISALRAVEGVVEGRRSYLKDDRRMWCSPIAEDEDYFHLLVQVGDKNISDVSFVDFDTGNSRESGKLDSEGGHFCSHVLIKKQPDDVGRYLMMIEKVPGIHQASMKAHFNWVLNKPDQKRVQSVNGVNKTYRGTTEIDAYQSKTVQEAMTSGRVMDLQFVGHQSLLTGSDEDDLVREKLCEVKWAVGKQLTDEESTGLLRRGFDFLRGWTDVEESGRELLIRVKSDNGQVKTANVSSEADTISEAAAEVLHSSFQLNEMISGFEIPLTQRYVDVRTDVVAKMRAVAQGVLGA